MEKGIKRIQNGGEEAREEGAFLGRLSQQRFLVDQCHFTRCRSAWCRWGCCFHPTLGLPTLNLCEAHHKSPSDNIFNSWFTRRENVQWIPCLKSEKGDPNLHYIAITLAIYIRFWDFFYDFLVILLQKYALHFWNNFEVRFLLGFRWPA